MSLLERAWEQVCYPSASIAIAERRALGTTARLVVAPAAALDHASRTLDELTARADRAASRFRSDSEVVEIARRGAGIYFVSADLAELLTAAITVARSTDGFVDPTVGRAIEAAGYDRDFDELGDATASVGAAPVPGWRSVKLSGRLLTLDGPVLFDLGSSAKAFLTDRAAERIAASADGVLVSLGGDVAVAGTSPEDGWPIEVFEGGDALPAAPSEIIHLEHQAIATSSTTRRRWGTGGTAAHHLIDPRTGRPAAGPWRTVSVIAGSCLEANAGSTGALIAGAGAEGFLARRGLGARLVGNDGRVRRLGTWPNNPAPISCAAAAEGRPKPQKARAT